MLNRCFNSNVLAISKKEIPIIMAAVEDDEMALSEHIEEFSQRLVFCAIFLLIAICLFFFDIKGIVQIFQAPAIGVKF